MRFITHDGRLFRIGFRHTLGESAPNGTLPTEGYSDILDAVEDTLGMPVGLLGGLTECWLTPVGEPRTGEAHGLAMCSNLDTYNKETGRRLSLARALQNVFPKTSENWKANRLVAWNAYFDRHLQWMSDVELLPAPPKSDETGQSVEVS